MNRYCRRPPCDPWRSPPAETYRRVCPAAGDGAFWVSAGGHCVVAASGSAVLWSPSLDATTTCAFRERSSDAEQLRQLVDLHFICALRSGRTSGFMARLEARIAHERSDRECRLPIARGGARLHAVTLGGHPRPGIDVEAHAFVGRGHGATATRGAAHWTLRGHVAWRSGGRASRPPELIDGSAAPPRRGRLHSETARSTRRTPCHSHAHDQGSAVERSTLRNGGVFGSANPRRVLCREDRCRAGGPSRPRARVGRRKEGALISPIKASR